MKQTLTLIALCACVLALGACEKKSAPPPTPKVTEAVPAGTGAATQYAGDPSMPSAAPAYAATSASAAEATAAQADGTRKPGLDSKVTPMPGQNNDHSAPLSPAKGASAP
jgi:uncharacterized protein involved in copper resistance